MAETIQYSPLNPINFTLVQNRSRTPQEQEEEELQIPVLTLVLITLYMLFGLLIGLLNSLTIAAIARSQELKNVTNMFVLSLTCADLLLAPTLLFINFLPSFARMIGYTSLWTRVIYTLFLSLMFTSSATSLLSILAIAVDRYFAVLHPYGYKQIMTQQRAKIAILTIWAYGTVLMFTLVGYYISKAETWAFVSVSLLSVILPMPVYLGAVVSQIVICLIASVILYIRIFFALRKIHQNSASLRTRSTSGTTGSPSESRESRRTTTTMALVLGALILSWLPYAVLSILATVDVIVQYNWYIYVSQFAILLLYANSFMNPIIYAARSAAFRQAYRKVLCCNACANALICVTGSRIREGAAVPDDNKAKTKITAQKEGVLPEKNGNVMPVDV